MPFADELKRQREKRELSQPQLAKQSGVGRSLISHMELGIRPPQPDCLIRLADFFRLRGVERQRFIDMGHIAHIPHYEARVYFEDIAERFQSAQALVEAAIKDRDMLKARVDRLERLVQRISKGE